MNKLLVSALAVALVGASALAQSPPTAPASVVIPAAPVVPAQPPDRVAPAKAALAFAADGEKCRFAFTQKAVTDARVAWATAATEVIIKFDPRLPLGERFIVVSATKQLTAIQKNLAKQDKMGIAFDLVTLMPEGEFKITALAPETDAAEVQTFSFKPAPIDERSYSEAGKKIVARYVGLLEVDRASGRVRSVTVRAPPEGVKSGIAKIRSATFARTFTVLQDRFVVADRLAQTVEASALISSAEITSGMLFGDVEPICDPGQVAKISEAEAAARVATNK